MGDLEGRGARAGATLPEGLRARYREVRILGAGAMGTVLLAEDRSLARPVAVKLVQGHLGKDFRERFLREARSLAAVRHENLVEVLDFGYSGETPYLVLEYLQGRSLEQPVPGLDVLDVVEKCARALEALHRAGLVHRDVKPANLFRTEDGRVVLTDLGLVYDPEAPALTATGVMVGTPSYLSPERMHGGPPDPGQDWWALGVTLYSLHRGRLPFEPMALIGAAGGAPLPRPHFPVGDPYRELVEALLHPEPGRRLGSHAELLPLLAAARDLEGGGNPEEVPLLEPRGNSGPPEGKRRFPWLPLLAAGFLALASGVGRMGLPGLGQDSVEGPAGGVGAARGSGADPGPRGNPDAPVPAWAPRVTPLPPLLGEGGLAVLREEYARAGDLDPDPLRARELREALPSLAATFRWIHRGGDLAGAPPEVFEQAAAVDSFLGGQAFLGPLRILGRALPLGEAEGFPVADFHYRLPAVPSGSGWLGRVLRTYKEARARVRGLEDLWERRQAGEEVDLPASLDSSGGLQFMNLKRSLYQIRRMPERRRELGEWLRGIGDELRILLFAAARSLEHEPAHRSWLVRSLPLMIREHQHLLPDELLDASPDFLLGLRADLPEQRFLLGLVQRRCGWLRRGILVGSEEVLEAGSQTLEETRRALGDRDPLLEAGITYQLFLELVETEEWELADGELRARLPLLRSQLGEWDRLELATRQLQLWKVLGDRPRPGEGEALREELESLRSMGDSKLAEPLEALGRLELRRSLERSGAGD